MLTFLKSTILSVVRTLGYEILPAHVVAAAQLSSHALEERMSAAVQAVAAAEASAAAEAQARSEASAAAQVASEDRQRVADELSQCKTMRQIHWQDAVEIEALYRQFVFPDLPKREGRAALLNDLIGTTISEAIYIIEFLHQALRVPGDICEFGVAQGATSRMLATEIILTDRKLWLFDSFEGLPAPGPEDRLIDDIFNLGSMSSYQGTMASPETEVLDKLAQVQFPRDRTIIKKGWVNEALKSADLPAHVAFAYVDFDFYEPIKDALHFLDGVMPAGGQIVVDDYGFFSEGAQLAVDEFVKAMGGRYSFQIPLPFAGHFCVLSKLG
ncbi:MAG TPA: TylF/MycF/NovP-related O-methyltransferase [Stellaceae bacterium]|nr:TylF/MycF/NovP-related O-methyltransferase [Stellaceae bacterium]